MDIYIVTPQPRESGKAAGIPTETGSSEEGARFRVSEPHVAITEGGRAGTR